MKNEFSRRRALQMMASTALLTMQGGAAWPAGEATRIERLYKNAVVIDSLSFADEWNDEDFAAYKASGYTGIVTNLNRRNLQVAIDELMIWRKRIREHSNKLIMALSASDYERAKAEGKLAVMMNFQDATMLEGNADNVEVLHALGMRCFQLTYNQRNRLGDGSTERTNAGLSDFGIEVVGRMNELGVLVDLSHCGRQTTLDGVAFSAKPVAYTHTMCESLREGHPRAKTDAQLRALAEKGGVVGIAAIGYFIGPDPGGKTTIETYVDHLEHAIQVAGIDHVALATDFGVTGIESYATRENWYEPRLKYFKPSYDVKWPPWIPALDKPDRFLNVAHILARRGHKDAAIEKILGRNWLGLFADVFGG